MKSFKIVSLLLSITLLTAFAPKTRHYTIYTIGDSTMANKSKDVYPETGWCMVLKDYVKEGVQVRNHAVNGRSTKSFIREKRWQAVLDSLKPGDYVFIQFGHNDEKENDTTRYAAPFGAYKENLQKFISETKAKGATPVLFTPIVRRKFDEKGKLTDTHGQYPAAVRELARETGVNFVDLLAITEKWLGTIGDEPSKEYWLWTAPDSKYPQGRKDDTHLSVKGANKICSLALRDCIRQKMPFSGEILRKKLVD